MHCITSCQSAIREIWSCVHRSVWRWPWCHWTLGLDSTPTSFGRGNKTARMPAWEETAGWGTSTGKRAGPNRRIHLTPHLAELPAEIQEGQSRVLLFHLLTHCIGEEDKGGRRLLGAALWDPLPPLAPFDTSLACRGGLGGLRRRGRRIASHHRIRVRRIAGGYRTRREAYLWTHHLLARVSISSLGSTCRQRGRQGSSSNKERVVKRNTWGGGYTPWQEERATMWEGYKKSCQAQAEAGRQAYSRMQQGRAPRTDFDHVSTWIDAPAASEGSPAHKRSASRL